MKSVPLRRCILSKKMYPKDNLFRVDVSKEKIVTLDKDNSLKGRGYYILKDIDVVNTAKKNNILSKVLSLNVDESIYDMMIKLLKGGNDNGKTK